MVQLKLFFFYFLEASLPPSKEFKSLEALVSEKTLKGIADMSFTHMTEIQYKTVMPLLNGRYCVFLFLSDTFSTLCYWFFSKILQLKINDIECD